MSANHILFIAIGFSIFATSCAIMNQDECQVADWAALGDIDGAAGASEDVFSERSKACAEYGVHANYDVYLKSRAKGLERFCTYESGLRHGQRGLGYDGVCPEKLEKEFLKGYELGSTQHRLEKVEKELKLKSERERYYRLNSAKCTFDSDCKFNGRCEFSKCK